MLKTSNRMFSKHKYLKKNYNIKKITDIFKRVIHFVSLKTFTRLLLIFKYLKEA